MKVIEAAEQPDRIEAGRESLVSIFIRFLKFGCLAWGGPAAQIAMIKRECVDEEGWIGEAHFKRLLAVYQVLPGPEAHELCVYFGRHRGGKWGGFLAGLGFMLPGFLLMLGLSALYVETSLASDLHSLFYGLTAAVGALVARALVRLGNTFISDVPLALSRQAVRRRPRDRRRAAGAADHLLHLRRLPGGRARRRPGDHARHLHPRLRLPDLPAPPARRHRRKPRLHQFLLGVAAGVVGLIGAVTVEIVKTSVVDVYTAVLAIGAFAALNRWHSKMTVVYVVLGCGAIGVLLQATVV
jgi:chromate transport protein ChrA